MRLAFVSTIYNYAWGGADTLWTAAAEEAVKQGHEVLLALFARTTEHPRIQALVRAGAKVVLRANPTKIPPAGTRLLSRIFPSRAPRRRSIQALAQFRPDLVVVSCGGTYCIADEPELREWLFASKTRFRLICNWQAEHPDVSTENIRMLVRTFRAAEMVFFVSKRNLSVTRRHLLESLQNAEVIQNPLRAAPEGGMPWPVSTESRFAAIGRLEAVKGLDLLLHAFADQLGGRDDWRLSLFGRGPQEPYLKELAEHRGIADRVIFAGYEADLEKLWREHHILVSPSLDEGVPMTIPEAMLRGRPVIATRVGGAEEWLVEGKTGFLCEPRSIPRLGETLQHALSRRSDWQSMGRAAIDTARSYYKPNDFTRIIL